MIPVYALDEFDRAICPDVDSNCTLEPVDSGFDRKIAIAGLVAIAQKT